jgi:hypothetical protein
MFEPGRRFKDFQQPITYEDLKLQKCLIISRAGKVRRTETAKIRRIFGK